MGNEHGVKLFTDRNLPFETEGKSFSLTEVRRHVGVLIGKYQDLVTQHWKIGDAKPSQIEVEGFSQPLFIENYTINKVDGEFGTATFNLVEASSAYDIYHQTATVDMQQVEHPLIMHPMLQTKKKALAEVTLWEKTEEAFRTYTDSSGNMKFRYIAHKYDSSGSIQSSEIKDVKEQEAINYCKAIIAGITQFMQYLPVIEITSSYLKIRGVNQNDAHELRGTLDVDGIKKLGTFADPPFGIDGFTEGLWFKGVDRLTQSASGTWQRTEQYTYTNDKRFKWIYDNNNAVVVIDEER